MYSLAFRLLRICSTEECFENRLLELKAEFLVPRGYKPNFIECQLNRVRKLPGNTFIEKRKLVLEKQDRKKKNEDRIIVPIDYNPHMAKPSEVFRKHFNGMLRKNGDLKEIFPAPPNACTQAIEKPQKNPL